MRGDVTERVNALTAEALANNFVKKRYAELGASVWPTSPKDIAAYRDTEEKRLLPIMKAADISSLSKRAPPHAFVIEILQSKIARGL